MRISAFAMGLSIFAVISAAEALERRKRPTLAAVDAAGRVVPLTDNAPDGTGALPAVCGESRPLSVNAARALVRKVATDENFYPDFVLSVAKIESRFNSSARSDKGAFGLMQLKPETAARFNVDRCDPAANVLGGVRHLRFLHQKYRNPLFILAAYNAGEEAMLKSRGVPPYPETVRFVAQVLNDFYDWPLGASGASAPSSATPDLIEPAAVTSAKPRPKPGWDGGFVMHID